MDNAPTIRNAVAADLDDLVDILSDSFAADPMFNWLFPSTQLYPFFFRMLVSEVYLPRGIAHIGDDVPHRFGRGGHVNGHGSMHVEILSSTGHSSNRAMERSGMDSHDGRYRAS